MDQRLNLLTVATPDLDAARIFYKPGLQATFGGYHGYFEDPNGVVWEIAHHPGWSVDENGVVRLETL